MANFTTEVLAHGKPIQKIINGKITGTSADTLTFAKQMTRLSIKNTGSASLSFSIGGSADLTDILAAGETLDDVFPEFTTIVLSGTTGTAYKVRVG
jgi:23S rRNA pseudoU1915 N3-methylase RlmH